MKDKLHLKDFDNFIWENFVKFIRKPGNGTRHGNGLILREGVNFYPIKIKNRNPAQVPQLLWEKLLMDHLKHNYN